MPLITTIEQVRNILGQTVLFMTENVALADMTAAEERYIIPVTGDTLYADMVAAVDDSGSPLKPLVEKAQRAVAPLAYWLDLPAIQSKITDRGAVTFASDNMQPLHGWEFHELKQYLQDKACFALEAFLAHLYANKATYNWEEPAAYAATFRTGQQFSDYYPLAQPHRVFDVLRPVIKDVETRYIRNTIGDTFFEYLRDSAATAAERAVAELMKNAVANLAIATACKVLPVKISPQGFTVQLDDAGDKPYRGEENAPPVHLQVLHDHCLQVGKSFLATMKSKLDEQASATVFTDYFNSAYYTAPVTEVPENFNEGKQAYFL